MRSSGAATDGHERPGWTNALVGGLIGRRVAVLAVLAAAGGVLAGCAQPGQLGSAPAPAAPPPAAPVAVTPTSAGPPVPEVLGTGTVDIPLRFRTPPNADYQVRTAILQPGEQVGWETRPGTALTLVRSGEVTVREQDACAPAVLGPGRVAVVGEGVASMVRNTGAGPAELLVTTFLTPGAKPVTPVPPACPE
ncbi:cupin domain-containing protein [Pseudonocardia ailaonensis]|uniref:cupin domain-containing protein n=1 Tax=Pseudonocardia ailaonensis TaxID=367279 RepID=UPI0031D25F74